MVHSLENGTQTGVQGDTLPSTVSRPPERATFTPHTIPPELAMYYTTWHELSVGSELPAQTNGPEITPVVEFLLRNDWRFHPNIPQVLYRPGSSELASRESLARLRNVLGLPRVGTYELAIYCQLVGMPLRECSPGGTRILYRVHEAAGARAVLEKLYVSAVVADAVAGTATAGGTWTTQLDRW